MVDFLAQPSYWKPLQVYLMLWLLSVLKGSDSDVLLGAHEPITRKAVRSQGRT